MAYPCAKDGQILQRYLIEAMSYMRKTGFIESAPTHFCPGTVGVEMFLTHPEHPGEHDQIMFDDKNEPKAYLLRVKLYKCVVCSEREIIHINVTTDASEPHSYCVQS